MSSLLHLGGIYLANTAITYCVWTAWLEYRKVRGLPRLCKDPVDAVALSVAAIAFWPVTALYGFARLLAWAPNAYGRRLGRLHRQNDEYRAQLETIEKDL